MTTEDIRLQLMVDWLKNRLLLTLDSCEVASSDASFRRYFRIKTDKGQFIVMDAPPDKENIEPFIRIACLLTGFGVHVPRIFQQDLTNGFLLLEDFGSQCFLDQINNNNADLLYQSAFGSLLKLQTQTSIYNSKLSYYDEALLTRELTIFDEWFLGQFLDVAIPPSLWQTVRDLLVESALEQPRCCVHRDYHSRNLMILNNNSPGVIDFQDAVIGPVTYDLVSLLRDCYITWPKHKVEQWRISYYQQLLQTGLVDCIPEQFNRWFDLMGMQRHLKAIGIFSRLHLRDGKSAYLKDIPRTLDYVVRQTEAYSEFTRFNEFLLQNVLPIIGDMI